MINTSVVVEDNRLISLILDFLNSRNFHTTMRSLEKESGVVNCRYSKDILFLRDLVLDGEWEAILIFAQPFEGIDGFDLRLFRYLVLKQKFMEVLYFKSGFGGGSTCYSIEDLIKCLNQLEQDCPSKTEYSKLCWLLTVPNLPEQPEYRDWNPATARIRCFEQILELLRKAIPIARKSSNETSPKLVTPTKDRLLHLVIKGLCFESCVEYCQLRAINGSLSEDLYFHIKDNILKGPKQESSGNFLSWLRNLSQEAFVTPFEPLSLEVDLKSIKQVKASSFLKSPKRDDAEILSRSLALFGRPATADIFTDKHAFDTDKRSEGKPANRPHTAQPSSVSHSHHEFHYRGTSGKEIPASIGNGFNEVINNRELANGHKGSLKKVPSMDNYNRVKADHIHPSQPSEGGNCSTEQCITLQAVHYLKEEQEKNVRRQLEAHEKQKLELQRELMELSQRETNREEGREDHTDLKLYDRNKGTRDSLKSLKNEGSKRNVLYQSPGVSLQFAPLAGNTIRPEDPGDLKQGFSSLVQANVDSAYATGSIPQSNLVCTSGVQEPAQATGQPSFLVSDSMTSTPATKTKHKPENLDIAETTVENSVVETVPVTPADQIFSTMPAGAMGHWVALSDGSGVLNTSTPKSKRQVMSLTPAPPTSPVHSANSTSNHGTPLTTGEVAVSSSLGDNLQQTGAAFDATKDKETPGGYVQQAPIKRGPKVNGVRRSLAPQTGTKQRAGANVDIRETTPPVQEPQMPSTNTQAETKVKSGVTGSATPRVHKEGPYIREELVESRQIGFRGKGDYTKNGTTFLVDQGAVENHPALRKAVEEETEHGGFIKVHKDSNVENVKEQLLPRNSETINMTYRKQSSTTPPNDTTVTVHHNSRVSLVGKQRNALYSLSDMKFHAVAKLEDVQAVRAIAFHPSGDLFAIGSNSKTLRVCTSEGMNSLQRISRKITDQPPQPTVLFKSNRHHRGSIYCIAWSPAGDIIATGSNDKSIKMIRFDVETCTPTWPGMELVIHNGTIRDLAFVSKTSGTPVLISGGAGDGNIAISDCGTGQTVGQLKGHSAHIMTVYAASDEIIASGSADNTVRLWDLRSQRCIDAIATGDSCVASVCVNSAGTMLSSGHEDGSCMIYDITAGRTLQLFKPHTMDCRSVRFSPDNNFLLTGSYDTSIIMMDLRKDLEAGIPPYSVVAHHNDKVIQCRWHPHLTAFLSSSADKTASLWALDC